MVEAAFVALNLLLVVAVVASGIVWFRLLLNGWGRSPKGFLESLLPARPRGRPFWSLADVLVMFGSMLVVSQLAMSLMASQGWIDYPVAGQPPQPSTSQAVLASIAATSIGGLAAIGIVVLWLRLFDRDARRKLGLTFSIRDLGLGLKAALLILPPVMLVSAAVAYFVPYEHPVLDSLAKLSSPTVFLATFIGTAIVTPLVEEFLVRVLLQGSLQGFADRQPEDAPQWVPLAFWPVVVSSLVFSVLHLGQGAAPIPLLVLSLGLGFLYRQTGSILPPMIVHMVLNGLTLIVEFLKLRL